MSNRLYHGGEINSAILKYGGKKSDWLDLSTCINPNSYSIPKINEYLWKELPQKTAIKELIEAAKKYFQCKNTRIIIGNGTQVFIEKLPIILPKSNIAILSPTYEEHIKNWNKYGHKVKLIKCLKEAYDSDHLLIVNPNNPDGKVYSSTKLIKLHEYYKQKKGFLIIDEAFIDMTPEMSMSRYSSYNNLIILRSFGKFFGLAGIRVGFMLANQKIVNFMQEQIGLWAVSSVSMEIATKALNDLVWQIKMRFKIKKEMRQMKDILIQNNFKIIGSTDLFCLTSVPLNKYNAYKYFEELAKQYIFTRKFDKNNKILRFGLVKIEKQNYLMEKLKYVCLKLNK